MLKIRLMRIGAKQRPFYRVVAVDERSKRNGAYVELLGTYNPLTEPKEIKLNQARIDHWLKQGAQLSDGFLRIIGKAPQRPARKPKKAASVKDSGEPMEKKEETSDKAEEIPNKETSKSSEPEAVGEAPRSEEIGVSEDTGVEQAHSEAQESNTESEPTEPSGASVADEAAPSDTQDQTNEPTTTKKVEEKR